MATLPDPLVAPFVTLPGTIVPDELEDMPESGRPMEHIDPLQLPQIVFGAGSFSNQYNTNDYLTSWLPLRTIRLALRYGIRAFDTSPYYGPSEFLLGNVLKVLEHEFPRSSYQLMTKCGRYGTDPTSFDYSPATIRASVNNSMKRLKTTYLDTVHLHDVEFICTPITPKTTGNHIGALSEDDAAYGLRQGNEGRVQGAGDQRILGAISELRKMKEEGLIRNIGISGYPIATLLRLAILVLHTPPYQPLDVILSYSHLTLQNSTFTAFASHFHSRARVPQLLVASPMSMGLLTSSPPPWHPAPERMLRVVSEALKATDTWPGRLPNLALGFSLRKASELNGGVPLLVGFSKPGEVHECLKVWRAVTENTGNEERLENEAKVEEIFDRAGFFDWSWSSP